MIEEAKEHVEDLLNRQWIRKSNSAWSSPVVLVRKKCGGLRFCCDFRKLNQKTVADRHPLPRVQSTLESLEGNKFFSTMDLTRAYYQGFVAEEDRHKTAFVTPWGLYEWVRIPFGLMNAPPVFQRHMEKTVEDFRDKFAAPYIDDVIVYSRTFEEDLQHVKRVLRRLKERGMKLNIKKCNFCKSSVKFIGRIVCEDGYRIDDESVKAVRQLRDFTPRNIRDVRHLLGLLGYHHRHIQNYSRRAKPLTDLLKNHAKGSKATLCWGEDCKTALG